MGLFRQIGAKLGKSVVKNATKVSAAETVEKAPKMGFFQKTVVSQVEKIEDNKTAAFSELDKSTPAPSLFETSPDRLTDAEIDAKLAELEKQTAANTDYLGRLNSVEIAKPAVLSEISYAEREPRKQKEPSPEDNKVPKGKCRPEDLVDVISNNHSNPREWNAEAISSHLNLRQTEVELFLSQFELVNEHAAFVLSTNSDHTSDIFSVRHEAFQDKTESQ